MWRADREKVVESAEAVTEQLRAGDQPRAAWTPPGAAALQRTVAQFRQAFDARHGGFGGAPKFPRPSELLFLLREHARTGDADAARDGACDAAGDGARRHARPRRRRVSSLLGRRRPGACRTSRRCCTTRRSSCSPTSKARRRLATTASLSVAEDTLRYVLREMTAPRRRVLLGRGRRQRSAGSAQAPSHPHKAEGAFYLWTAKSWTSCSDGACGRATVRTRCRDREAPLRREGRGQRAGRSAAGVRRQEPAVRRRVGAGACRPRSASTETAVEDVLARARLAMFAARLDAAAAAPRRQGADRLERADDCGVRPDRPRHAGTRRRTAGPYVEAAQRAAAFIRTAHVGPGIAARCCGAFAMARRGSTAYAEDYAYLIFGLARAVPGRSGARVAGMGRRRCRIARTSCSGTRPTAAGSARPAGIRPCWCA